MAKLIAFMLFVTGVTFCCISYSTQVYGGVKEVSSVYEAVDKSIDRIATTGDKKLVLIGVIIHACRNSTKKDFRLDSVTAVFSEPSSESDSYFSTDYSISITEGQVSEPTWQSAILQSSEEWKTCDRKTLGVSFLMQLLATSATDLKAEGLLARLQRLPSAGIDYRVEFYYTPDDKAARIVYDVDQEGHIFKKVN